MTAKRMLMILSAALLAGALLIFIRREDPPPPSEPPAAAPVGMDQKRANALFPGFETSHVTAVSIRTPQAAFDLRQSSDKKVSVNGQRGDRDVFVTLLEHIAAMEFTPTEPFATQDAPLLTLIVRHRGAEYSAAFYDDGSTGEYARIVASSDNASLYGLTDGWRVGTLLLACEGTRIQDASGRETPAE